MNIPKKMIFKTSFVFTLLIIYSLFLVGCNDEEKDHKSKNQYEEEISSEEDSSKEKKLEQYAIGVGSYEVGNDISAGEYLVDIDNYGFVEVYREKSEEELKSSDDIWQVLFNTTLQEKGNLYVEVKEGENIEVIGAKLYPIDKAPTIVSKDKPLLKNGMYKVGRDIPEGTYEVSPTRNADVEDSITNNEPRSMVEIYKTARYIASEDLKSIPIDKTSTIQLSDGEFLYLKNVEINKSIKNR
ncbi:hypothetical protein ABC382_00620 [Lysinibacillus sp. 1P01SD]|uniref:hypothetical protein n=1 Tax=Lysinibacillus sp. 1P01SD TaxID=3132285 RepID=UPI00399F56B0